MSITASLVAAADGIAFGIPGGGPSLELADAIERAGGRFHTTRFEGAAALMAGAVGRLRGRAGLAVWIKGPGLANQAWGLATAWLEDLPVIAVTEAFGPRDGARMHKRLDHAGLVGGVVKGHAGLADAGAAERLLVLASAERPGPVLLDLAETDARIAKVPATAPRDLDAVLRAINAAKRPVVIAGALAARLGLSKALDGLSIPVFSTAGAKGIVNETRSHAAGVYTGVGLALAPESAVLAEADLVVGIGLRAREILGANFKIPIVNVDDIDDTAGFALAARAAIADAARIIAALSARPGWGSDLVAASRLKMRQGLLVGPFLPAHAFTIVRKQLPRARLVLDTGFFCTGGEHMWDVEGPDLYLSSGQGRSMGAALPMAIAAVLHRPDAPTVLAIGDGGIGMFAAELALAAAERAPLLVLFMCDGTYASVRDRAVEKGLSQRPLIVKQPDWTAVAAALGFTAARAADEAEVAAFVSRWKPDTGPAFLQIDFAPEPYRVMTRALRA